MPGSEGRTAQVVLGQQRHHVAGPQPGVVQHVGQLGRAPLELAVGDGLPGPGHDRGDPVRRLRRVGAWVHGRHYRRLPPDALQFRDACDRAAQRNEIPVSLRPIAAKSWFHSLWGHHFGIP